jgi:hypothetical protein
MDCGYLLQPDTGPAEQEGPPNLCTNPACGVANPPGERNCQRCGTPLPIAGGTILHGRYRLDKLLKTGGFGQVYQATDTKHQNRPVAIKDMIGNDPQESARPKSCARSRQFPSCRAFTISSSRDRRPTW